MENTANRAIAIVGAGAILPDAANVPEFWENVKKGRYSITEVRPERWDPALYYDPDHSAPDKTYSKIGGWVRNYVWDPVKWRLPIPPRVVAAMDESQKWAIACTREALEDYGYPKRPLNADRTAVILGNAIGGEKHYFTVTRILFPEFARELEKSASFAKLPEAVRHDITDQFHERMGKLFPEITEDTMPGELSNCIAGRIANVFNFHGPNYVCDAACASAMAAISTATEGLVQHHYDVAVAGGLDRNMGVSSFVKFCKIGALSASGTRPYADGADGFVMGEGAAIFLLKRLADAEHDGDKIYAVLRGMGGSSDGKGKGITAPNPVGQKFAIERAWENAGLSPGTVTLIEGHGTSTAVGDVVEAQSMIDVLASSHLPAHSVALGSVKSNFGHLKGAAGAAGLLKASLALRDKVLPPSVHCEHLNPNIDFAHSPLYVNTELRPWTMPPDGVRRAGLSAFGFGGTNFHAVLEEYIPGKLNGNGKRSVAVTDIPPTVKELTPTPVTMRTVESASRTSSPVTASSATASFPSYKAPLRGALVIGASSEAALIERLRDIEKDAKAGHAPAPTAPAESDLRATERLAIDYANAAELAAKATAALKALTANQPAVWKALRAQGIFRGQGPAPKVAFLYTGQGSQYVNMLNPIRIAEPIVAEVFAEADRIMAPVLAKPLTEYIYVDPNDPQAVAKADEALRQTEITQPAVMAIDTAMTKLLEAYGITPDFTMGHSVGEYGALIASGGLPFEDALHAVSARGRGMTQVAVNDKGLMAAVFAPLEEVERTLKTIDGYVVIANINSEHQTVIGGATEAVKKAIEIFQGAGYEVAVLPVSHAFHTSIVAGASVPLRASLEQLHLESPRIPIVANVTGEFYPTGPNVVPQMLDMLSKQVAAPVQFVKGLRTLYDAGARVFVEVGPKKALQGFAEDVLGPKGDVVSLFTNHPKTGDIPSFNQALCGLYAAGLGRGISETVTEPVVSPVTTASSPTEISKPVPVAASSTNASATQTGPSNGDHYNELGHLFADVLDRGYELYRGKNGRSTSEPVVITGAALGLPGTEHIFDDGNVGRILRGEQLINLIPAHFRQAMLDKHITRLVKSEAGEPRFETLTDVADVIKLAGRGGAFDLENEYGLSAERVGAFDRVTQLAIAAGLDALRDAGIPLVMRYKTTTKGTQLPERWGLPDSMRDDTGVIFASAFPGYDAFADEMARYYADHERREQLATLESVLARAVEGNGHSNLVQEITRRIEELRAAIDKEPYVFNRRFLLRVLPMGHSQFAEFIGARGPNTQINAACASNTQGVGLAQDWIRAGRCSRVIVISADDITTDHLIDWMGAGFLATGAAATDEVVTDAAIPFDRRRHGMLIGMGAAGLVVESAAAARERGIQPICEVLSTTTNNSAFHATRLDVQHIGQVMETLVSQAEAQSGTSRRQIAPQTVFVSHETYTPARGGSASAEIHALRKVFGDVADRIVIANTKGFTGHAMGTGIEDVVAVKALETGCVPPVANFKEVDPELGLLNLSKGGSYPVEYAIHLGAGFGSQISMMLLHWIKTKDGIRRSPDALGYGYRIADESAWSTWLSGIAGHPDADLEVVHRTLRVRDQVAAARVTEISRQSQTATAKTTAPTRTIQASAPTPVVTAKPALPAPVAVAPPAPKVQVAAAAPRPTPPAPPKPAAKVDPKVDAKIDARTDWVRERVLALVAEKTGYPGDMLDLDLDLEADLGVDTVKQAEVFAAIREIYNIPRDENRKLRDYPTLAHVIRFVYEKRPDLAATPAVAKEEVKTTSPKTAVVAEKPAPAPTAQVATGDAIRERILALVVEKTGYPQDMLDLDLDLEADLGVDTVKQAEMFAAIRAAYDIPRDENLKLRDYPTLARVIQFVYEKRPDLAAIPVAAKEVTKPATPTSPVVAEKSAPAAPPAQVAAGDVVKERILALVVEKTGYPKDMLDLDLDLEADLGVDTVKQAEMFAAIREIYSIPRDENRKLRDYPTLAHVIRFVFEKRPDLAATPAVAKEEPKLTTPTTALVAENPAPIATFAQSITGEDVKERILALVVEKTGYPKDMLDLDLDLEADLGVDTVKQAEMFAAIREIYSIPRDENRKLRDYPTLAHVIRFVFEKRPDLAGVTATASSLTISAPTAPAPLPVAASAATDDSIKERVLEIVAEKTGYPKDMLDLDLDLEADLGVDTVKQAEMFAAVRAAYNIPRDENLKLRDFPTLASVIKFARDRQPGLAVAAPSSPTGDVPAPIPAVAQVATDESIKEKVLEIVAEKTGYPKDMLDLDLDLEADLGVDTVKQAEMFAAVRAAYNIPRDENLKLRDFPTLASVIKFARDRQPGLAKAPAPSSSGAPEKQEPPQKKPAAPASSGPKPTATPRPVPLSFDAANRIPRRVPVPNLRPPLALCKPTGVTLASGRRVVIMPDKSGVGDTLAERLQKMGVEVLNINLQDAPDTDTLTTLLKSWLAAGPVHGIYWLPALDNEGKFGEMDLAVWHEALRVRVKSLYAAMRILFEQVAAPGTFLVSATRLGGQHGYDEAGATAPLGGAVVGFTKTYKRERTDTLVKAVDFEAERKPSEVADILIEETLRDPGAVEVGYKEGLRWTVGLQEQPAADGQPGLTLNSNTVFVVTGAAGSIVSAITADLATASGGTFYLLDLVPEPDPENPDLKRFVTDKDGLKRDLFARIQARGERATPALVEKELAALERAQAANSAIAAVRAAGGTAHYFSVNLTDADAVAKVIKQVRERSGRIDVLLHAAGTERSHFLPDKDAREFDLVFDVKSDGWFNLLHAIGDMPLGATVAFSSIAGRFGNAGQTDYSSANDLLCKITSSFRTTRPATRGIVIDWTAWGGVGMATRGSIPKMMELAGIDMLPLEAGTPLIRRELTAGGTKGEIVIGQRLGVLLNEWDATGGLDTTATESSKILPAHGPMVGKIATVKIQSGLTIETKLDPTIQPFLHDHQIDGTPVLPGVMGVEAFAEAALCLLPGWHVEAIEDVNFLAPFKFYRKEPRVVTVEAVIHPQRNSVLAECRLTGRRSLPNQAEPQVTTHFTAQVRLTKQTPKAVTVPTLGLLEGHIIEAADIYRLYFHGPAYQVVERAWWDGHRIVGLLAKGLPVNHLPSELPTLMAPRLIELCFQTAGVWEMGTQGRMGLPQHFDRVSSSSGVPESADTRLYAVVTPDPGRGCFDAEVVDAKGNCYLHLGGYRTVEVPNAVDAEGLKALQAAMSLDAVTV
jgi:acyl transferase domain-containing protein/acyl carrier protein/NAD(P)-dependent dehydrogenase (short-subunit alcohol dehydrogenase family)